MKKLVVLTGAGMSAESGISTFRDSGGLWEQHRVEDVATIEGYIRDPELVINFYNERRRQLPTVQPCRGHELVAELEKWFDVTVVTQNVDDLHERAGSTNVIHLHGELMKATSTRSPNDPTQIQTLTPEHIDIHIGDKAADGSQLRPFIVWFGEAVPMIEQATEEAMKADIFVVIGTSLNVYPAAGLIQFVSPDVPVYLIDPKDVPWTSGHRYTHIKKGASAGMVELVEQLKNARA
ncbi:MAG: NAD-dependent deacylase [Bacteroidaceae bacterium]|nr:NAD-dependent deacylase [Bacteroidaceae bacterium]